MVSCPKCGSEECVKDGIVNGRQRIGVRNVSIGIPLPIEEKILI